MSSVKNVCARTVEVDLCIGCGVCAAVCPTGTLQMSWETRGLLVPIDHGRCSPKCQNCLDVCPFLEQPQAPDILAKALFGRVLYSTINLGRYSSCHVGYAGKDFRERGASGGLASWFLAELLAKKIVDHVITVRPTGNTECLYEYTVVSTPEEVQGCSKSAYYPVTAEEVIKHVMRHEGQYALIGLPCFIKALRLAQLRIPLLKNRLRVLAGLVCGQTKSRHFTKYLVHQAGLNPNNMSQVVFRGKRPGFPANQFELRVKDNSGKSVTLPWNGKYSRAWTSGMFSPRACSFCDDTFAEMADISFMDAWLPEHTKDPNGTSLVICRSTLAESVLQEGQGGNAIKLSVVPAEKIEISQEAVVQWKRRDLGWRLWLAGKKGDYIWSTRVLPERPPLWHAGRLVLREKLRKFSLEQWSITDELHAFDRTARRIEGKLRRYLYYLALPEIILKIQRSPIWVWKKVRKCLHQQ